MASTAASSSSERGPPSSASPATVPASSLLVSTTNASASLPLNDTASLNSQIPLDTTRDNVWTRRRSTNPIPTVERIAVDAVRTSVPEDVFIDSQPLWAECIAGYFIDEPPSIAKLHSTVNRLWRKKNQTAFLDVRFLNPTTAIITVPNQKSRDWILEKGVWHIGTTPMIVKQWSPTNAKAPVDMSRIPVWVDFHDVPDSLFAEKGLKFLGDIVGKYLKLHTSTEKCLSLEAARVLVEVNFETDLIKKILLTKQEGDITIRVAYPWIPRKCEACQIWGHDLRSCTKSSRKEDQPTGNEKHSESVPGFEQEKLMAVGQASPSTSNTNETSAPNSNLPRMNGLEETATTNAEQTHSQVNVPQVNTEDTEGWETVKGRKSPRKSLLMHHEVADTTVSPNKYRVLRIDDTEDGEIAEEETTEVENPQREEPTQTGLNVVDDPSIKLPMENEPSATATRNLQLNTGGTRGGRGRGRPRKNNNTNFYSDAPATTNNKSIKASFGKH